MNKKIKKTLLFSLATLTLTTTCASSIVLNNQKQLLNNKTTTQNYNIGTISNNSNKTTDMSSFISLSSNTNSNNDNVLNNVILPAHLFSNSDLSEYSSEFKNANFSISNNSETNNAFESYVNNERNKIISYIQNYGLQENGFSNLLENELDVPESFVNENILNKDTISLSYTSYLWEWINWNSLHWLNNHSLQDTIEAFDEISSTTPWKFFKIQINNQDVRNNYYYHFIKSIALTNITNNIYEISISTQPDFNITLNSSYIKDGNYKINISINDTNNINNSNTNSNHSSTSNSTSTTNNKQNTLINNLNNEIEQIQNQVSIDATNYGEFDYTTMTEQRLLAWEEAEYIKAVTNNGSLSSEAFNDWNTMNGYYHWTFNYWDVTNRSYCYKDFMKYINDISDIYHSEYIKYNSMTNSPLVILSNEIDQLSTTVNSEKKNGEFILNVNDMTQARLLAWYECEYIKDAGYTSLANSNFNVWYQMNNYYHLTINGMSDWNKETGWYFIQFCLYLKEIQSSYDTSSNPYSTGLNLMQKAITAVNRYASEEEAVAIASSVATAISIATAAAYWAGSWFFGITVPEAIAATTAAISTASAMAGMWTSYHATQTLQTNIKDNTFSWMSLKSEKSFYSKMKKDWKKFRKYFTKTYKAIMKTVKIITALEDVTVDTCSWADPILAVVGVVDLALATSILFSNLVINAVNTTWLNGLFII